MKLQRIFMLGCMVLAIALVSCSGEDGKDGLDGIDGTTGPTGAAGPAGADGQDGQDGVDGVNGVDGNANVTHVVVDLTNFDISDSQDSFEVPELTLDVLNNYVILAYLRSENIAAFAIPGAFTPLNRQYWIHYADSSATITVLDLTGQATFWTGTFSELDLFFIEPSSLSGKSQEDVMASLKANGVDTNNYREVMQYFGLE